MKGTIFFLIVTLIIIINLPAYTAEDINKTDNSIVSSDFYTPEYATLSSSCWTVDVWNIPLAGNQDSKPDFSGNMKFFACGDTISPLYQEAFVVAWIDGGDKKTYSNAITSDSTQYHLVATSAITVDSVGQPSSGIGYSYSSGYWSTPDNLVHGKIEYFVPGHQDTAVLIEKVTIWNESGGDLNDFLVGEEVNWDCDRDSSLDESGIDFTRLMIYQKGDHNDELVVAGLSPYGGHDAQFGAGTINGYDHAYFSNGHYPDSLYNLLSDMDGTLFNFADSINGTEMRSVYRFWEGTLGAIDTLQICKVKAVSLEGVSGLQDLIDKGFAFIENNDLCEIFELPSCSGMCGDANYDGKVNVSDAVYIINYVFIGGDPPQPILMCGNANNDLSVGVSDAVYIINYVFVGGNAPGDCNPGSWPGGDCCPFAPMDKADSKF